MVAAPDRLSARRGREAALIFNSCPSAARTPRASGSLLFGVASIPAKGNHFVFLLRGFAGVVAFGLLHWGRQVSLCCAYHYD
ncbi:hypothetical protein RHGRI_015222 [Rhododendron griersonianum]|uniref:Uncharacterized protein n=1 Tax=Rhododendron griersonianum TaxID=479676 RepID=A0AAV6KCH2_9ERIC|nr:hypothetical protein RHGRI_015222 [Rhododendron griersonianum]